MERIGGLSADRQRDRKAFLPLLRRVRIEAKLTQTQLAKILGVTQSRVSKYEQGERRIDMLELKAVCDAIKFLSLSLQDALRKPANDYIQAITTCNPFWSIPCWVPMLTLNVGIGAARKQKTTGT